MQGIRRRTWGVRRSYAGVRRAYAVRGFDLHDFFEGRIFVGFVEDFAVVEEQVKVFSFLSAKSSGRLLAVWSLLGCSEQGVLFPEGSQVMVKELLKACPC